MLPSIKENATENQFAIKGIKEITESISLTSAKKLAQVLPFICIFAQPFLLHRMKGTKCQIQSTIVAVNMDAKNVAKIRFECFVM